jgi:hypothetical protein
VETVAPLVVGLDGSDASLDALGRATAVAAGTHRPVRAVTVAGDVVAAARISHCPVLIMHHTHQAGLRDVGGASPAAQEPAR